MVAAEVLDELQVTVPVRFCDAPLEYTPVAVKLAVVPGAILVFAEETVMETSVAGVAGVTGVDLFPPPQPVSMQTAKNKMMMYFNI